MNPESSELTEPPSLPSSAAHAAEPVEAPPSPTAGDVAAVPSQGDDASAGPGEGALPALSPPARPRPGPPRPGPPRPGPRPHSGPLAPPRTPTVPGAGAPPGPADPAGGGPQPVPATGGPALPAFPPAGPDAPVSDAAVAAQAAEAAEAMTWGRVDDEGQVWLRTGGAERLVGSWQAGDRQAGLAHFARRYAGLAAEIDLLHHRLESGSADPKLTAAAVTRLRESLPYAAVVGDVAALERRLDQMSEAVEQHAERAAAARAAAKARATAAKRRICEEAESLAGSEDWRAVGERFRALADAWKHGKTGDRPAEQELWQRFAAARATFTRRRTAHFAAVEEQRRQSAERKQVLVAEAEQLSASTEWGPAATRLKQLMAEWKAAGRAGRDVDDHLWARFRAAQDGFFERRSARFAERDAALKENVDRKEAVLTELEALDPGADPAGARNRLRVLQERWEKIGHVPREAVASLEARLRRAEQRVYDAVDAGRPRGDSPAADRARTTVEALRESISKLEEQAARASAAGQPGRAAEAAAAAAARRGWLSEAEKTLADLQGPRRG